MWKRGHLSYNCKCTQGKKCLKCGNLGHFAKCCKTDVESNQQSVNQFKNNLSNDERDNEVYMFSMKHKSTDKRYPINTGSKETNMLIDSGSTLNILDEKTYKTFDPVPILKQSNTKIFTYHSNTSLEVLGTFKAYTTASDKALFCKFYVVKGHGGNLLGKESAEQFNLLRVGPPEKVINALSYSKQSNEDIKEYITHPALQTVLDKHKDVFQRMEKLKNYKLKLHIDESATPVQHPVRRLPYHARKKVSKRNY